MVTSLVVKIWPRVTINKSQLCSLFGDTDSFRKTPTRKDVTKNLLRVAASTFSAERS